MSFSEVEVVCPCRNKESSFVLLKVGRRCRSFALAFFPCCFFQVVDVLALVMHSCLTWSHDAFFSTHSKNQVEHSGCEAEDDFQVCEVRRARTLASRVSQATTCGVLGAILHRRLRLRLSAITRRNGSSCQMSSRNMEGARS